MWPKAITKTKFQLNEVQVPTFHLYRKHIRSRQHWDALNPDWEALAVHMYTRHPGKYHYDELYQRPFTRSNTELVFDEQRYDGPDQAAAYAWWQHQWQVMQYYRNTQWSTPLENILVPLSSFRNANEEAIDLLNAGKNQGKQARKWKTKKGLLQIKTPATHSSSGEVS